MVATVLGSWLLVGGKPLQVKFAASCKIFRAHEISQAPAKSLCPQGTFGLSKSLYLFRKSKRKVHQMNSAADCRIPPTSAEFSQGDYSGPVLEIVLSP